MPELKHLHMSYHLPRMSELKTMFWVHTFAMLASSLAAVFVPALLYRMGFSLATILVVYIAKTVLSMALQFAALEVSRRFGANRTMAISQLCDVIYYGLLFTLARHPHLLILFVVVWAVDRAFYWSAFHANFSQSRSHEREGIQVGLINALVLAIGSIAPAFSGLLIDNYGPNSVYAAAIAASFVAALPLLRLSKGNAIEVPRAQRLDYRKIFPDLLASAANGVISISDSLIWPLFIFLIVGNFTKLGIIMVVVTGFNILASLYIGRKEHAKGGTFLSRGLNLTGLAGLLRLLVSNGLQAAGVNVLSGVGKSFYQTPFFTSYYRHADQHPRMEYVTAMEVANSIGLTLFLLGVLAMTYWLKVNHTLLLALAVSMPVTWGVLLIRKGSISGASAA